ncbi:metabolite traffic protein EboE [Jiulongibacter sp. NS-SX5]|uniref:metabolite traffic protein EboE n=1 Tax=Jiulongibacter sp. NS-SX5 TaxID=3463854 RepID=UPI00405A122C
MFLQKHKAHLTYCSNIHPGETWKDTLANLETYTTEVREKMGTEHFGVGLRISGEASKGLLEGTELADFKNWLEENNLYVFTINGFPYGNFHSQRVKDHVHSPDWLSEERLAYSKRLFTILNTLLPEGMDGGVSTSPVSYRHWFENENSLTDAKAKGAEQIADLALFLHQLKQESGKSLHLDMEPEPDGILETGEEFIQYYNEFILPTAIERISKETGLSASEAEAVVREHIQICFDVCHFAVGFENIDEALQNLKEHKIKVGRIQISAALGTGPLNSSSDFKLIRQELETFDEPVYLHQAVCKDENGGLTRYKDLGPALAVFEANKPAEMRTHFHVPIFLENYKTLVSTQKAIVETLKHWKNEPFTPHLEVETYTWGVLPQEMQTDIVSSVCRELQWVIDTLDRL